MHLLIFLVCIIFIMVLPIVANSFTKKANENPDKFWIYFFAILACWTIIGFSIRKAYTSVLTYEQDAEYQLQIYDDGYLILDQYRRVGFIPAGNTLLDTLMIDDNL